MSELRHRGGDGDGNDKAETAGESDHVDSEEEKVLEDKYVDIMAKNLPQGTDKTPEILDSALSGLSSSLFAWTHVALLIVVTQSYLIIQNIFEVPVSMIICNDVMAYVFGFFFGKTPLIKLSPKKTWEGFIGGGFSTVVFGLVIGMEKFNMYPFMIHSLALSIFSSVIGPFGGFFASGFKRAFKIKDFGDVIPGHGGIMDRFDCQFLMATFVNVYITSFIRTATPQKLLQQVYNLKPEQQLQLFYALKESLENRNILNMVP
ncbi:hypothetical protein MSG28_007754 [Choristoneura fumiferana]|uniref:Uncharacterized protein n=1 Tax=Choristoneura fumiferana TaxID=7141 RepID=A0ACC0JZ57_CHOFU|nr:hypothetical protein MSG28_007754 [Choristoneura fumiferana]